MGLRDGVGPQSDKGSANLAILPEVHAASAGLKSFCTTVTSDGMEDARKCCGGHGYSSFSGLPDMVATHLLIYTGEGENYLMTCVEDDRRVCVDSQRTAPR